MQGYLADKNPRRTVMQDYDYALMVLLGGGAISYARYTPVGGGGHGRCLTRPHTSALSEQGFERAGFCRYQL